MGSPSYPPGRPPGDEPPQGADASAEPSIWSLRWKDRTIALGGAPTVLGRSSQCDVQIDDPLVSRRHASLQVSGGSLFLEDLRSANGVFVNGERVRRPRRVLDGDRILLGNEELLVVCASGGSEQPREPLFDQEPRTLDPEARSDVHEVVSSRGRGPSPSRGSLPGATTEKAEAFTMLGRLADRLLDGGRPERAVRVLADLLREVLDAARTGFEVNDEAFQHAREYAVKLANATSDGRWVDYLVELHLALREPLAADLVDHVQRALERGVELDVGLFTRYQTQVRELRTVAKPAERALCDLSLQIDPRRRS